MKIVITGSSGFVGKHLRNKLSSSPHEIIEVDLQTGFDLNSKDILDRIEAFDLLIHLAANTFVPDSFNKPQSFYFNNIVSTLNALELCRKYNARIIFNSSYVYGSPEYLPIDENHPVKSYNPYAESKIIGERLVNAYHRDFGINGVILRPFNLYGPGQNSLFIIPKIIDLYKKNLKIQLGDPEPKRDYLYINDLISAMLSCIDLNNKGIEIFNLGYGKSYSAREIVEVLSSISDKEFDVSFDHAQRKNEVADLYCNYTKAKLILGWSPVVSLESGMKKMIFENV